MVIHSISILSGYKNGFNAAYQLQIRLSKIYIEIVTKKKTQAILYVKHNPFCVFVCECGHMALMPLSIER